jgi:hypothetical protein
MSVVSKYILLASVLVTGCSGQKTSNSICSAPNSILDAQKTSSSTWSSASAGLLLSTHYIAASPLWDSEQRLSKCNTKLELLDLEKGKVRLWSAAHCIRPLLLTSLKLAVRNEDSALGGFNIWELSHPMLEHAKTMRTAYNDLLPATQQNMRDRLVAAFDRSSMWVKDESSVLEPRTSCENLRWQTPADSMHALCFSIHDLSFLDIELPEPRSTKSRNLLQSLEPAGAAPAAQLIAEQRSIFMRRINLLAQTEWITSQEQNMTNYMKNPQVIIPSTDRIFGVVARLQKLVFDLPHPEESSFMTPVDVVTQDKPAGQNETLKVVSSGTYTSPRLSAPLNDVGVSCVRSLRKLNESGEVVTLSELEYRPHEYCPGGANPQPGHVWYREHQWARMIADLTVGAAQDYSSTVSSQLISDGALGDWKSRLSVVSNFSVDDKIDFFREESQQVSPFLNPLRIPAPALSEQLYGWQQFSSTGAFVLAMKKENAAVRFLKGDSGALLLLDGVPIAALHSVDGEETSGGASILPLPTISAEDDDEPVTTSSRATGTRQTVGAAGGKNAGVSCLMK